ncbi:TIGR01841 family phasin [Pseudoduganella ginsengisoli]|uniref:TIGR01841 family phasin n=1 Tax=Pseudoduganella ginsengisoli TaxID=1462440 RepID=A0A6L6PT68_9BURK|nr:TIGR01841 family phasin [Pseudoduganella ginsengisoli]MTW00690.1 TIGR01841 family phasin [Pseudoduganella ginsengisoli]
MNAFTDQFSAATASAKSQIESQLDLASHYANTAFAGVQQVIALNFSTTRASVEKSSAVARQFLEARDPRDFIVQAPDLENLLAYSRELYSITSKTQAELAQLVKDQFKEATATVAAVAAKPLELAAKVASQPVAAPAHNEPAESEIADAPAVAPKVAKAPKAEGKPAAKPLAEAVAELSGGHVEEESKPVAAPVADVQEAKPVVLKSVSPKK